METAPQWVIIYLVLSGLVSLVASKKGRSGWAFLLMLLVAPVPLMATVSYGLGNAMDKKPFAMWVAAFICPIIGLVAAVMSDNEQQVAVERGEYGQYKKCPYCAEPVRTEAVKCKHCHSELSKT